MFGTGDFGAAASGVEIGLAKLRIDLGSGDPLRLERRRIEDHADVAINPALARYRGDAANPKQAARDIIVDVPAQLLETHVVGLGGDEQNRITSEIDPSNLWLEDSIRQIAADLGNRVA